MTLVSGKEQPVAGAHLDSFGADLEDSVTGEDKDPLVVVLVIFERAAYISAQYLLDDHTPDSSHLFGGLADAGSFAGGPEPTCDWAGHVAGSARADGDSTRIWRARARASGIAAAPLAARATKAAEG